MIIKPDSGTVLYFVVIMSVCVVCALFLVWSLALKPSLLDPYI